MKAKQDIHSIVWLFVLTVLLSISVLSSASDIKPGDPKQVVNNLQMSLLQAMHEGDQLDYSGRYEFLTPAIDQSHDIDLIIRTIIGATLWSDMKLEQQTLIKDTFRRLSIATYAGRFIKYGGEQFEIIEQKELPRDQILVRSRLIKGGDSGDSVNFDYVLQQSSGEWRIVNILFDGVSDLAIKRREYRAILQRDSFSALIEMLEEKIVLAEND